MIGVLREQAARERTLLLPALVGAAGIGALAGLGDPAYLLAAVAALGTVGVLLATDRLEYLVLPAIAAFLPQGTVTGPLVELIVLAVIAGAALRASRLGMSTGTQLAIGLLLAYLLVLAVAATRSVDPGRSGMEIVRLTALVVFAVALVAGAKRHGPGPLALAVALVASVGALVLLFRFTLLSGAPAAPEPGSARDFKDLAFSRVGNVNTFGFVLLTGIPMLVAHAIGSVRRPVRLAAIAGLLVSAAALLQTVSRAAMLGAVVAALAVVLMVLRPRGPALAGLILALAAGAYATLPALSAGSESLTYALSNYNGRVDLWAIAIDLWRESPLVGHGPGTWEALVGARARLTPGGGEAHNIVLSGLVHGGLLGAGLQVAFLATAIVLGVRATARLSNRDREASLIAAGATAALIGIVARGMFESTGPFVTIHWFALLSWALIALVLGCWEISCRDDRSRVETGGFGKGPGP